MYLSYHQQVARVHSIMSASTDLESTSVLVAWGLDLFCTRVAPSGTYDQLAAEFNYVALIATVVGVLLATLLTSKWATKRELQIKWA
jgi:ER membrane protein complex subunit 1